MLFALFLTPIIVLINLGGFETTLHVMHYAGEAYHRDFTNIFAGTSFIGLLSLAAWGLGYFGQPHILARFMSAKDAKAISSARRISITWMIICLLGAVAIGFFGQAYFYANPEVAAVVNNNHEQVFIELAKILFNPWIAGILLSAILAAVMSTLSCQLLICSSAITEDFYKGLIRPDASQKELVWIGRVMVLLVAVLAIYLAQDPNSKVLGLVSYAWAGFGCAFGPVVILSLFWKRMNKAGAMAGMLTGALVVVFWNDIVPNSGVYEMIPGFILASLAIVGVSLLTKEPSAATVSNFEQAEAAYFEQK